MTSHPTRTDDDDESAEPAVVEPVELLSLWHGDDGRWELRGELDADHGAILNTALREAQDALFQRDGVVASKVEALVEIANRSLDSITDTGRRDRYRVHVHVDVDNTMLDGLGYRLPAWLRDLICCDTIVSTVNEAGGIPVSVGRTQRTVPERTRRLVILRDRGCRVPGLHRGSVPARPSRHPLGPRRRQRPDRHVESGVFVSAASPAASPRPARDLRQRRRPARADLHRQSWPGDAPRRGGATTHRATTPTDRPLPASLG